MSSALAEDTGGPDTFEEAKLRSERLRILGLLAVLVIFVVVGVVRAFVLRTTAATALWGWGLSLVVALIGYELWMLRQANLALRRRQAFRWSFWIASSLFETAVPGFAMILLVSEQVGAAYRPLASPAVLVFFIFITLSTLRLNVWLSCFSGLVAASSYLAAALYLGWRPPLPGAPAPVTQTHVALYALMLLVSGLVAGAVAGQIRVHLTAALREVETKKKLEVLKHDLQVARSIQQSLLPHEPPHVPGFDIAGWNCPADDTGGDYFDWKVLSDGRVVVTLADVTGHGIGPALLAAVCRAYARSSFAAAGDLTTSLERINDSLAADLAPSRFVTFVAAVCCPNTPEVELLSAGHGPLFLYSRRTDRFTEMGAQGVPFGVLPVFRSDPPVHIGMGPGDLVVLATDGFFEWENDRGEEFGVQRMEEVLRRSRDAAASQIVAELHQAVTQFANGSHQQDDLTAVVIKRLAA